MKHKKVVQKSRKELRKEQRKQKKVKRALYHAKKNGKDASKVITSNLEESKLLDEKQIMSKTGSDNRVKKKKKKRKNVEHQKKAQLKAENVMEDKEIKYLEKQLKLNKRKSQTIPKSFVADGLDYLLDFCDEGNRTSMLEMEKQFMNSDEEIEDGIQNSSIENSEEEMIDAEESEPGSENDEEIFSDNEEHDVIMNESLDQKRIETAKNKSNETLVESEECTDEENESLKSESSNSSWEDIYGRRRDKKGNIIESNNKYIPPAIRQQNSISDTSETTKRLKKQLKGLVNRLAEHNMHIIVGQLDELYMSNSRNDMNQILSTLILEALVAEVLTPDRLICEHMMLIAILHANIGLEVGAYFLQKFVTYLDEMLQVPQHVENKQLENLILMIAHMYNFKVFGHQLMYEILERLSNKFTEKEIELILLILKTVGFSLRKDNPLALKEFIIKQQKKAGEAEAENCRIKFMLDVLMAIKNNNMNKIPQYDPSHVEHLRKIMKNFIRKGNSIVPFNISMDDLLHADERGKWWMVGSAWTGHNPLEKQKNNTKVDSVFDQRILNLAQKQRMNTDVRRNIFCILMTAEDYLDAFEKIHHLGLKGQQEREIIHVLVDCCLQEKTYNPYYAVLAQKFCDYNRKYQIILQYSLWDKLKMLENYTDMQLNNLAQFLTYLFIEKGLNLSVMKVINFAELNKPIMKLLKNIILGILLYKDEMVCMKVFDKISLSLKLQSFKENLKLFIKHFLIKNIKSGSLKENEVELLRMRVEMVEKVLNTRESKLLF